MYALAPFMRYKSSHTLYRIDVSVRLRRAILRNDLPLVKRIIRNDPQYLQNPDFSDQSNTSLHLAAQHGFIEIAVRRSPLTTLLHGSPPLPISC